MTCQARRVNEQMLCGPCGLAWDLVDPEPPRCLGATPPFAGFRPEPIYDPTDPPPYSEPGHRAVNWYPPPTRALLLRYVSARVPGLPQPPEQLRLRLPGGLVVGTWPNTKRGRGEMWEWAARLRSAPL